MITFDRLKYFIAAAQFEHIGKAATTLHISPSVISSAIKDLENETGVELFIRIGNRIQLNPAGRSALESAHRILRDVEAFKQHTAGQASALSGHFRLGASQFLLDKFLVPACLDLQKTHKDLMFDFVLTDSSQCFARTKSGQLDCALVFRSSYGEKINERILISDQFKAYVRKNHEVLRKKGPGKILSELPAITFKAQVGENFWQSHPAFADLGLYPKHVYYYDDTSTALTLLMATNAWAFLPSLAGSSYRELAEIKFSQKFSAPVNVSLIYDERARTREFVDKLMPSLKARSKNSGNAAISPRRSTPNIP